MGEKMRHTTTTNNRKLTNYDKLLIQKQPTINQSKYTHPNKTKLCVLRVFYVAVLQTSCVIAETKTGIKILTDNKVKQKKNPFLTQRRFVTRYVNCARLTETYQIEINIQRDDKLRSHDSEEI